MRPRRWLVLKVASGRSSAWGHIMWRSLVPPVVLSRRTRVIDPVPLPYPYPYHLPLAPNS